MIVIDLSDLENPDGSNLANKTPADIQLNIADISASSYTGSADEHSNEKFIKLNYYKNGITIQIDQYIGEGLIEIPEGFDVPVVNGTMYYTPLYTEKLNYDTWLTTINRNFQELN